MRITNVRRALDGDSSSLWLSVELTHELAQGADIRVMVGVIERHKVVLHLLQNKVEVLRFRGAALCMDHSERAAWRVLFAV